MRKIVLDELPKWDVGSNKGKFNWKKCVGYTVKFIYDDIESYLEIVDYKDGKIGVKYLNNEIHYMRGNSFSDCKLGVLLNDFKLAMGESISHNDCLLIITDRIYKKGKGGYNRKYYKYTCNKCGWTEGLVGEYDLVSLKQGCACCSNKTVVQGINDLYTTDYWMVELGVDEEFAKTHTRSSGKKAPVKCPHCFKKDEKIISNIYKRKSLKCVCNSGGFSYPEKFVTSVLNQLNVEYENQLTKTTFKWVDKYKYDFIVNKNIIIETHGEQHYYENTNFNVSLKENQENDRLKKELALNNGIKEEKYIIIDCRESSLKFIKNSILNSSLPKLYDLSNVDWEECSNFALSNLSKKACDLWNESNGQLSCSEIGKIVGFSSVTISKWLKKWTELGFCDYDPQKESNKFIGKGSMSRRKRVEIFKNDVSLGIFESVGEIERVSLKIFGVRLGQSCISGVCRGKSKQHKGFTFKYV